MNYKIEITPTALKPIKKQPQEFKDRLYKETQKLVNAPLKHRKLSPPLSMCRSYHFIYKGTSFRIAYTTNKKEKKILIVLVGPREGFYETLQRRVP